MDEEKYVWILANYNDYIAAFDSEEKLTYALGEFIKPDLNTDDIYYLDDVDMNGLRIAKVRIR